MGEKVVHRGFPGENTRSRGTYVDNLMTYLKGDTYNYRTQSVQPQNVKKRKVKGAPIFSPRLIGRSRRYKRQETQSGGL